MKILTHDQRGIAHLALILVIVVVLGVGGAGYYVWNKQKKDKSSGDTSLSEASKATADACNKAYDDKDFCKFASSWSYGGEQKMTITSPEDGTVTVIETDANGNTRMTASQNGAETSAMIAIGKTSYIKNAEAGNWTKYTAEDTETPAANPTDEIESEVDFEEEIAKGTSKITKNGKEACGSLTCFKYTMTDSTAPGEETIVWFDDKDYKLRRMTVKSSNGTSDMAFEYSVAAITEPSPVVEMPKIDENMSAEELQQLMEQYAQ